MHPNKLPDGFYDEQERPMGLFLDMPEAKYHGVRAFSYSGAKQFARSPRHFKAYLSKEFEVTPSRQKFKAVHLLCLEPQHSSKIIVKEGTWRGAVKEEVEALTKQGFLVVKPEMLTEVEAIKKCVQAHSLANAILSNSLCEVSLFWVENGVYCKCRIDILSITDHGICLGDLKNYGDLSNEGLIGYQIGEQKYNWQQAFYSKGIKSVFGQYPIARYWIFVEEKSDDGIHHGVKVRRCPEALVDAGWTSVEPLLAQFKRCQDSDTWPSYEEDEQDAGMPDRYFPELGYSNE